MTTARTIAAVVLTAGVVVLAARYPAAGQHAYPPAATSAVVPYNVATYGPPGGATPADVRKGLELLASMDKRLEAIEGKLGGVKAASPGVELVAVAKKYCASCHTPAKAEKAGGGFELFRDDAAERLRGFSPGERAKIKDVVQRGFMPPGERARPEGAEKAAFE